MSMCRVFSCVFGKGCWLFIIEDWNANVESQEIPGVTGKFGFGVQSKAGQRLTEFCQEYTLVIANTLFQQHKRSTQGHHQMVNIETRLIRLFTVKDGDALYSQDKQDWSKLWLKS